MSDAGVIGYEPRNTGSPESSLAAMSPHASAVLPDTLVYVPDRSAAGLIEYVDSNSSAVSPKL